MPLHTHDVIIRAIDRRCNSALQRYLDMPRSPMDLRKMSHCPLPVHETIPIYTRELAIRTAYGYSCFRDPAIAKKGRSRNASRLKWVESFCLREFKFCLALEAIGAKYIAENNLSTSSSLLSFPNSTDASQSTSASVSTIAANEASATSSVAQASSPRSLPGAASTLQWHSGSTKCVPGESRSADVISLLDGEDDIVLEDIPFDVALDILRPQLSLLDIMVNETAIGSDEVNSWFSCFCCRRVAWRVIHEHLMNVVSPELHPRVVCGDTSVVGLLQQAGNVVVDIFSKLVEATERCSLTIDIEEDSSLLTHPPKGVLLSSSRDLHRYSVRSGSTVSPADTDPSCSRHVYSIEGHLSYVFRELLKNACVAMSKVLPDITVQVRYAVSDEWVVVDFVDEAGGIPAGHARDIWRFGWTTSDHYESHLGGFGVGLPTSKVYMDTWGGSIDVYSATPKGTTVRVRFPKSPTEVLY